MPTNPTKGAVRPARVDKAHLVLRARQPALLLANPNYFGTVLDSDLPVIAPVKGNTSFETLTCVGLNPTLDQAEAVVRVNANSGYGGTLCNGGSREYVRFFVSYDGGANWVDVGMDSFSVHDTTGARPLDFAVNLPIPVKHRWCFLKNQPTLRAILSWSQPPTAGDPNFVPIWGNVVNVTVQPTGSKLLVVGDLVDALDVTLPEPLVDLVDVSQPLELKDPPPVPLSTLVKVYAKDKVEPHRFVFPQIQQALLATGGLVDVTDVQAAPDPTKPSVAAEAAFNPQGVAGPMFDFGGLDLDLGDIFDKLATTDGNTDFEELGCIGYDPVEDALVGVITIKRPSGYSGGPCTAGSTEYVAFWMDWGSGLEYVGTASVKVHDIAVPPGGLRYAVFLPIASFAHRRACVDGPVQPKVRAILSWAAPPPTGSPDWVPTWGNREETNVQLPAGVVVGLRPVVDAISGVPVCSIDQSDGRTIGADQPFGGIVTVTGFIPGAPDISAAPMKYRVRVRDVDNGGSFKALTNDFGITVTQQVGASLPVQLPMTQSTDPDDFYTYREDPNVAGAGWRRVVGNVLAVWSTSVPMTGRWEVEVVAKDPVGTVYSAQTILCVDGTTRANVRLRLDEVAPTSSFSITHFIRGGTTFPAQECMKFKLGDILVGSYAVSDQHFRHLALELDPAGPAAGTTPTISGPSTFPLAPTNGTSGMWELNTAIMAPCGYVLRLRAWDRTIVHGNGIGWEAVPKSIGFSLEA